MTAEKAAERQAARDNLVRELCEALEDIVFALDRGLGNRVAVQGSPMHKAKVVLARAKEQQ